VKQARQGRGLIVGSGSARTNPIHEADVAAACVEALTSRAAEIACGGPDTFTRREIVEMAFAVVGQPAKLTRVPPVLVTSAARLLRPVNPRVASLVHFGAVVSTRDVVAPARGVLRLRVYFEEHARTAAAA
jgi:uncharacterized protein YbjT (DUF2867 family)